MSSKPLNNTAPTEPQAIALIVDDEISNRMILKSLLKRFGYKALEAKSGREGIELFSKNIPDVVFMDVLMPEMDGYEATIQIKAMAGAHFVPVIFLTALTDESALVRCIEVGGDDFLTKPFSHAILQSKLIAMARIKALHQEVNRLYSRMRQEEEIAQKVFSTAVVGKNVAMDLIPHRLQSAAIFSGDLLLTARAPSGDLHLLLGDFTGHGLSAALGALPATAVFRAMTAKGFPPERILAVMNEELNSLLPAGMFLAATFIRIPKTLEYIQIFNNGLPDAIILDPAGNIRQRIAAQLLPLGILPLQDMSTGRQHIQISPGWRIILVSDGVTEAKALDGTTFGQYGLEATIHSAAGSSNFFNNISNAFDNFCEDIPQTDDFSIVEIPCIPELFKHKKPTVTEIYPTTAPANIAETQWQISLCLHGARLAKVDPVPVLISQIQELEESGITNSELFNILTRLYGIALDQGLLGIQPTEVTTNNAIAEQDIPRERDSQDLATLPNNAAIRIQITCEQVKTKRRLRVHVENTVRNSPLEEFVWL